MRSDGKTRLQLNKNKIFGKSENTSGGFKRYVCFETGSATQPSEPMKKRVVGLF
jgi:hypothetical protein